MNQDAVDIIIINRNANNHIQKCIQSVKDNTDGVYKLIVVDRNSTDGSREWLEQSSSACHLILNNKTISSGEARNQGFRVSKYPWVVFIDGDVIIKDKVWLDKMWVYTSGKDTGVIEGIIEDGSGHKKFHDFSFSMVRKQCFNEIGYFDRKLNFEAERDWIVRMEWSDWDISHCFDVISSKAMEKEDITEKVKIESDTFLKSKYSSHFLTGLYERYNERRAKAESELK